MKYATVFFDADDTLFDYQKSERFALSSTLSHLNIDPSKEIASAYKTINSGLWAEREKGAIGIDRLRILRFEMLFEKCGLSCGASFEAISDMYLDFLSSRTFLMPGAESVCGQLHGKGVVIAIITNGITRVQTTRLENSPIRQYIDRMIISEEIGTSKPDKAIFEYAFSLLPDSEPDETLIVGDSLTADIKGGILAGIDTCWYNPDGKANNSELAPAYEIASLHDLLSIL